jgi:hypothetical protein
MRLARFVDRTVARLRKTPVGFRRLPPQAVPGSIFSGAAGIAFFLHEVERLTGKGECLPLANRWLEAAQAWAKTASREEWTELPWGFLIGACGLGYVDALLGARGGDAARVSRAVSEIEASGQRFDKLRGGFRPTELLGGLGGFACAARDLDARLPHSAEYASARTRLARVGERATARVLEAHRAPIDAETPSYRGLAHGLAGDLWALVMTLGADHPVVKARLTELAALHDVDEDGLVYWLPVRGTDDLKTLGTWCNGIAGMSLLWTEVARQRGTESSLRFAGKVATSVHVVRGATASLCCGRAGQALAMQRYADVAGDSRFAKRAYARLTEATTLLETSDGAFGLGLWQGTLGVALAALWRLHGERTFPCIEPLEAVEGSDAEKA